MAVSITTSKRISERDWELGWTAGNGGPYHVKVGGVEKILTSELEATVSIDRGEFPIIEILDGEEFGTLAYPGRFTLGWEAVENTLHYLVQEFVDAAFVTRQRIRETGIGYYSWESRFLEDDTEHNFQIVPVGLNGVTGIELEFTRFMRRHPDPPDTTIVYDDGTGKITVTVN